MKLSVVILTKNSEDTIERCLTSIGFADEIIVIDDHSSDKTQEKVHNILEVRKVSAKDRSSSGRHKVIKRKLDGDFASQRNFGMEKASGDWILFVDADEEVTRELKDEISRVILNSVQDLDSGQVFRQAQDTEQSRSARMTNQMLKQVQHDTVAYYLKRRDYFWGRELKYGETMKARNTGIIRLVKKNSGSWIGKVHEEFKITSYELRVTSLKGYLNHYPHPTVKEFLQEVNFYSTLRAKELFAEGKRTNMFAILFYPLGKFILTYFLKMGFLDGPPGFAYAFFMSFHSFLVRVKLYQYDLKKAT